MTLRIVTHYQKQDKDFKSDPGATSVFLDDKPVDLGERFEDRAIEKAAGFVALFYHLKLVGCVEYDKVADLENWEYPGNSCVLQVQNDSD